MSLLATTIPRLTLPSMPEEEVGPEAVKPVGGVNWHLAQALEPLTLCGELIPYGSRRRLWAETDPDERCHVCLRRLSV